MSGLIFFFLILPQHSQQKLPVASPGGFHDPVPHRLAILLPERALDPLEVLRVPVDACRAGYQQVLTVILDDGRDCLVQQLRVAQGLVDCAIEDMEQRFALQNKTALAPALGGGEGRDIPQGSLNAS